MSYTDNEKIFLTDLEKNDLIERIDLCRKNKGISSLNVVFIESGVGKNFKSNLKTSQPSRGKLTLIANYLDVTVDYLLGKEPITQKEKKFGVKIPVFSQVAAGLPIDAIEDIFDYEEIPEDLSKTGEFFGLVIKGDSMEPRMTTGDVVIVRSQPTAETGDIAIVLIDGETATCKKIKRTPEGIMLISLNPSYEPMFYSNLEIEQLPVEIIGKVVELRAKFN